MPRSLDGDFLHRPCDLVYAIRHKSDADVFTNHRFGPGDLFGRGQATHDPGAARDCRHGIALLDEPPGVTFIQDPGEQPWRWAW